MDLPSSKTSSGEPPKPGTGSPASTASKRRTVRKLGITKNLPKDWVAKVFQSDSSTRRLPTARTERDTAFSPYGGIQKWKWFRRRPISSGRKSRKQHAYSRRNEHCFRCSDKLDQEKGVYILDKCLGALCRDCVDTKEGAKCRCEFHPSRTQQNIRKLQATSCVRCSNANIPLCDLHLPACEHPICKDCAVYSIIDGRYHCKACLPDTNDPNPLLLWILFDNRQLRHKQTEF